jgi:hypothetical protein
MNGPATRPNGPTTRSGGGAPDQQPNPEQADAQAGGGQQQDQQQASARGDRQGGQRGSQQANARGQQQGGAQQGDGQAQQGNPQVADARGQQPVRGGRRGGARGGDQQQAGGLRQQGGQNATAGGNANRGDMQQLLNGGGPEDVPDQRGPITGTGFRDWSDRLRDVEEMVNDPQLRGQAAQIRDRVRAVRSDFNRHTVPPNWDMVSTSIVKPLVELRDSVNQELMRRQSAEALVPIDREPVPTEYAEQVRQYYERLGSGR